MNGIKSTIYCPLALLLAAASFNAKAGILSLQHSIKNKKAIVSAQKKYRKISFNLGMGAVYSTAYISALKSGRKRSLPMTDPERPASYDFSSEVTLIPSSDILVTHSNKFLMGAYFRDTTTISYENEFLGNDVSSTMDLRYDSMLSTATIETNSVMNSSIADFGYSFRNGLPAAVFISNDYESNLGRINMNYIPTAKYDIQENDYSFSNRFDALIRLKMVDFKLGLNETVQRGSGSSYSRILNVSSENSIIGFTSRDMETDTWRNGNTFFWKNGIIRDDGPQDLSVKTSYSWSEESEEKKFYVELIWR